MAELKTVPTLEQLSSAFSKIAKIMNITRKGIIVNLLGQRVGQWQWTKSRMMITPDRDENFIKELDTLKADGVSVSTFLQPTEDAEVLDENTETAGRYIIVRVPLTKIAPGQLDQYLKTKGYYLIDYTKTMPGVRV